MVSFCRELVIHQPKLIPYIREDLLTREDLEELRVLLTQNKALSISPSKIDEAGGFSGQKEERTGNAWVRDNIYLALALCKSDTSGMGAKAATRVITSVTKFFQKSASRFDDAISNGRPLASESAQRASVHFDSSLHDSVGGDGVLWDDKQNSALGYYIWLRCRLCCEGKMPMTGNHLRLLGLMFEYLAVIEYWSDPDTGHWLESEKVNASSIGAVLAAIKEFRRVIQKNRGMMAPIDDEILDMLEEKGQEALDEILPQECIQYGRERDVDSALLFLVYPLDVVSPDTARAIVKKVSDKLMGPIGVRRFKGDSYWCKDFQPGSTGKGTKPKGPIEEGEEAQWCVFDPILSAIYGKFYMENRQFQDLKMQQLHLQRSLAHVTGDDCQFGPWLCPESYYMSRNRWIASDTCPLLWAQANLDIALSSMDESISESSKEVKSEFKKFDLSGEATITVDDLMSVLTKLNSNLKAEDLQPFLERFVNDGKISFGQFVDELFCGETSKPAKSKLNLQGLQAPPNMSSTECSEVERVVTEVLGNLDGEFEGEYYPLPRSETYPMRPGGMSEEEQSELEAAGYLFVAAEPDGKGVFTTAKRDMAVLINARNHIEIVVKPLLGDVQGALRRLQSFEKVLRETLTNNGHSFC